MSVLFKITQLVYILFVFQVFLLIIVKKLDIKVKEPDFKELIKGRTVYLPPRFMTCNQAIDELLEVEEKYKKGGMIEYDSIIYSLWS